jgi:hypothetical protein
LELGRDDLAVVKPADPDNTSPLRVFIVELFFTFILICCILHNIYPRLSIQTDMVLAVMAVTTSIYFCASCAGAISGAVFNPVVGVVNLTFVAMVRSGTGQRNYLEYLPSYLFATSLGGILAGFFCKYLVIPSVPLYYETLLESVRDDYSKKHSIINSQIHSPLLNRSTFNSPPSSVRLLNKSTVLREQTPITSESQYLNPPEF